MVTRDDVAREAGTSTAVVSYVMNNGPRNVSPEMRERVLAAAKRLDYHPNTVARSLRSGRGTAIGVIVSDITNTYCNELVLALEDSALERDHSLLIGNTMHDDARQAQHLRTFLNYQVRGIIFVGSTHVTSSAMTETARTLESNTLPLVFLDQSTQDARLGGTSILIDNEGGAYRATKHLLDHGHTEVTLFSGLDAMASVGERTKGWERALREAGIDPATQRRTTTDFDRYQALDAALGMFDEGTPQAIFAESDEQAVGIMFAASQRGVRIPEDVALASFDGIRESAAVSPPLTTAAQSMTDKAEIAIETILEGPSATPPAPLPTELVVRASCGC